MAHGTPTSRFERERRRSAVLATALLLLASAYATLLALTSEDGSPSPGTRPDAVLMSAVLAGVSCAGIVAAARPSSCRGLLASRRRTETSEDLPESRDEVRSFPLVAHHCSCGRFADHTLRVGGRPVCAGCLGMAAGGACGIAIAVSSGAGWLILDGTAGLAATLLAVATSATGLVLLYRPSPPGWHAAANLALVTGTVLLAVLLSRHGLVAGAFGLLAALALVGLRIEMSRWRHLSVYAGCPWQGSCRGASALETARRPTHR